MKRIALAAFCLAAVISSASLAQAQSFCDDNPNDPYCQNNNNGDQRGVFGPSPRRDVPPPPPSAYNGNDNQNPDYRPRQRFDRGYDQGRQPGYAYGDNQDYRRFHRRDWQDGRDPWGSNGTVLTFNLGGDDQGRCDDIKDSLRGIGFRRVRAYDCSGREFGYYAMRDGQNLKLIVSSSSGRINKIQRAY